MCWCLTDRAGERSIVFWHGLREPRAVLWLKLRYFQISLFFVSSSSPPASPSDGPFFQPGLALCYPQFFLNHKLIFWQFSALLALIYFAPLALFAVASYFLADVQHVGVKWTQEARNVGVFVFSYAEGITWGQILLGFRVFDWRQRNIWINKMSCSPMQPDFSTKVL